MLLMKSEINDKDLQENYPSYFQQNTKPIRAFKFSNQNLLSFFIKCVYFKEFETYYRQHTKTLNYFNQLINTDNNIEWPVLLEKFNTSWRVATTKHRRSIAHSAKYNNQPVLRLHLSSAQSSQCITEL